MVEINLFEFFCGDQVDLGVVEEGVVDGWVFLFIKAGENVVDVVCCSEFYLLFTGKTCLWLLHLLVIDLRNQDLGLS